MKKYLAIVSLLLGIAYIFGIIYFIVELTNHSSYGHDKTIQIIEFIVFVVVGPACPAVFFNASSNYELQDKVAELEKEIEKLKKKRINKYAYI